MPLSYPLDNNAYADSKLVEANQYTDFNVETTSRLVRLLTFGDTIITKKNMFDFSTDIITVKNGRALAVLFPSINNIPTEEVDLTASNLDTGSSFLVGNDYYIYLLNNGNYLISLNSTAPSGFSTTTSKKIGGFHFGHVRKVTTDGNYIPVGTNGSAFSAGWENNVVVGIIPNSVWDLVNRPKCSPEGMVKVGNIWVDIYLSSAKEGITFESGTNGLHVANGLLESKYGKLPATGSEGLNWYNGVELARRSGKRYLGYNEWIQSAYGNPQGQDDADNYGWTKTTNTGRTYTGCNVNTANGTYVVGGGVKQFAISAYNIVDAVGNTWEWLSDMSNRQDSTSWNWYNVVGTGKGQAYLSNTNGLVALLAGAYWDNGVRSGSRTVDSNVRPWVVNTLIGFRLSCDAL